MKRKLTKLQEHHLKQLDTIEQELLDHIVNEEVKEHYSPTLEYCRKLIKGEK